MDLARGLGVSEGILSAVFSSAPSEAPAPANGITALGGETAPSTGDNPGVEPPLGALQAGGFRVLRTRLGPAARPTVIPHRWIVVRWLRPANAEAGRR